MSEEEKEVTLYSEEEWKRLTEEINKLREQKKAIQKIKKNEYAKKYNKEHKEEINKRIAERKSKLTEEEKAAIREKTLAYRKEWYKKHAEELSEKSCAYKKKIYYGYKLLEELYKTNFKITENHINQLKDIYDN